MIGRLLDAIDGLNILPHRYDVPRVGTVRGRQVRSMPVRPYLVRSFASATVRDGDRDAQPKHWPTMEH
jgi:hypothetical protein